jgi:hypothetical protein
MPISIGLKINNTAGRNGKEYYDKLEELMMAHPSRRRRSTNYTVQYSTEEQTHDSVQLVLTHDFKACPKLIS